MSALPQASSPPPLPADTPAGLRWIELAEAARRSGRAEGHLCRRCRDDWASAGLAQQRPVGDRGQLGWWIHESADPVFARAKHTAEFDRSRLTDKQRRLLSQRETAVAGWRRTGGEDTDRYLDELAAAGVLISRRTLYNWFQRFSTLGTRGLVDSRWTARKPKGDDPYADFYRELEKWWLDQHQPAKKLAYAIAAAFCKTNGWAIPSYRDACRFLLFLERKHRGKVIRAREGDDAFDNQCGAFTRRDYTRIVVDGVERPMRTHDWWCADHHICDTIVTYKSHLIRPWLSAIMDIRSRKIVGYVFSPVPPDSSTVLLAFRHAIYDSDMSIPLVFYIDNGKDFDAWFMQGETKWERKHVRVKHNIGAFKGVLAQMHVRVVHANPHKGRSKPIEPWFGTYEEQFGKLTWTYCGRSPAHKPPHLAERISKGEAVNYEEYCASAAAYIQQIYHHNPHGGGGMDGRSPAEVYAACFEQKRTTTKEAADLCLRKVARDVRVRQNGVQWQGRYYGQSNLALSAHQGEQVYLFTDPNDHDRVIVRDLELRLICEAEAAYMPPWGNTSERQWKQATAAMHRHNRQLREIRDRGMGRIRDPMQILLEDRMAQAGKGPDHPPTPGSVTMIRTGFEGEANAEQTAFARAVGAESLSAPTSGAMSILEKLAGNSPPSDDGDDGHDPWAILRSQNHERADEA